MIIQHRKNYSLLALAIVYFIIAIIQFFAHGILGTQLYFSIAFISLNTTLCEFVMGLAKLIRASNHQITEIISETKHNAKKHIELLERYPQLSAFTEQYQRSYNVMVKEESNLPKKERRRKFLNFVESIIPFVEIYSILSVAIITPLKIIPNNFQTTKVINVLALLSVALAFLSIYVNESASEMIKQNEELFKKTIQTSDFYLGIIESISATQSNTEEVAATDDKRGASKDDHNRETL